MCVPPVSVLADPLAGATLTVFGAGAAREVRLGGGDAPVMTVYGDAGPRQITLPSIAPPRDLLPARGAGAYFRLSGGYRHGRTRFDIAADPGGRATPNVLSELTWNLPQAEIRLDAGWTHASGFTLRGHLAVARVLSGGRARDSDYALDGREGEFSRSYSSPKGSVSRDYSLGAGWRFALPGDHDLTPMIGLARYAGKYRMRDGKQIVPPLGDFDGLDSRYEPEWRSGWIGLESESRPNGRLTVRASLKHHWFSYRATADWNLRGNFAHPASFRHLGHGTGWEAGVGVDWRLGAPRSRHALSLDLSGRRLRVRDGRDITYFANGRSAETQLNGVDNGGWALRAGYRLDY
ncbi:MAG: hypothetical protein LBI87_14800 [Candidatus Accumulibacter sp.]|nr:hypothetical protein [Accumulibacter sp.]